MKLEGPDAVRKGFYSLLISCPSISLRWKLGIDLVDEKKQVGWLHRCGSFISAENKGRYR